MAESKLDSATPHPEGASSDNAISLLDLLLVLAKHKKIILGVPVLAGVLALLVAFLLPNWYIASAKIMPPQQSQTSALAILGQLGGPLTGASQALGLKNPSDIYVTMLKSRTVGDQLVERFNLQKLYGESLLDDARKELAENSFIFAGRDGVIVVEVEDKDPTRAANIANAYVEELRDVAAYIAVSEAGQRRVFFEGQLKKAKNDLTIAELELKQFTQDSGLINPQDQIGLSVSTAAALRAQIAAKEIQLSAMRTFATEINPEMKRNLQELIGLRVELAKMEKDTNAEKGNVLVPFGKAPEVGLEYVRRYRDMKYHETLFEVLAKQYEIARIDEAKDLMLIQVLDKAIPPERKSKPKRALIAIVTTLVVGFAVLVWVFMREAWERASQNPVQAARLAVLRNFASFR